MTGVGVPRDGLPMVWKPLGASIRMVYLCLKAPGGFHNTGIHESYTGHRTQN